MAIRKRRSDRAGRAPLRSPGRPPVARRKNRLQFWAAIAAGWSSKDATLVAGVSQAVGSIGDNALAGSVIGLFKTEVIKLLGPSKSMAQLEWQTLNWVAWYNAERLHSALRYSTPNETEEAFHTNPNLHDKAA